MKSFASTREIPFKSLFLRSIINRNNFQKYVEDTKSRRLILNSNINEVKNNQLHSLPTGLPDIQV